jgi:tRNA(Ile)-lysidine synthase
MKGNPKIIPHKRGYILRPFLLNKKERILEWAELNSISFINDKTNLDLSFDRNFIRHEMMPYVKRINPGIEKTIRKKILSSIKENNS